MKNILKVLSVLAAVAGIVYVVAAYGDKLVAWCKKLCPCKKKCGSVTPIEDVPADVEAPTQEDAAQEAPVQEDVAEEAAAEEAPAQEPVVSDSDTVAEEVDFEG